MDNQKTNFKCKDKSCYHDVYKDKWCIFHLPKLTDKEKDNLEPYEKNEYEKLEKKFLADFFELLRKKEDDPDFDLCRFTRFHFVRIDLSMDNLQKKLGNPGFQKAIYFDDAVFYGKADFTNVAFNEGAHFFGTTFKGDAIFVGTKFKVGVNFFGTVFKTVDYSGATFDWAVFAGAKFTGLALFHRATFKVADFQTATFKKARFEGCNFKGSADFGQAKFDDSNFSGATFDGETDFNGTTLNNKTNFNGAFFGNKCAFRGLMEKRLFNGICFFRSVETGSESKIIFEKVNLSKISLIDTNLENFVFDKVDWYCTEKGYDWFKRFKPRKIALWDEYHYRKYIDGKEERKKVDFSKLADNYHQLVLNYERKRDFYTALQFRIGEMEVKRKSKGTSKNKIWNWFQKNVFNAFAWYRYLSNYGTSYWQAFIWLILFLFIFSGIFMLSGFETLTAAGTTETVVSYNISLNPSNWVSFGNWLSDLGKSVLFTLSILTFQKARFFAPQGGWSQLWQFIATIAFYSQVAITLLAIRRRFKQ